MLMFWRIRNFCCLSMNEVYGHNYVVMEQPGALKRLTCLTAGPGCGKSSLSLKVM